MNQGRSHIWTYPDTHIFFTALAIQVSTVASVGEISSRLSSCAAPVCATTGGPPENEDKQAALHRYQLEKQRWAALSASQRTSPPALAPRRVSSLWGPKRGRGSLGLRSNSERGGFSHGVAKEPASALGLSFTTKVSSIVDSTNVSIRMPPTLLPPTRPTWPVTGCLESGSSTVGLRVSSWASERVSGLSLFLLSFGMLLGCHCL